MAKQRGRPKKRKQTGQSQVKTQSATVSKSKNDFGGTELTEQDFSKLSPHEIIFSLLLRLPDNPTWLTADEYADALRRGGFPPLDHC